MKRPERHSYTDACDAYLKVTALANLAVTTPDPKKDRSGFQIQVEVLGNNEKMEDRLHRFKINDRIVFPTVTHFVDALDAAGFTVIQTIRMQKEIQFGNLR